MLKLLVKEFGFALNKINFKRVMFYISAQMKKGSSMELWSC
jgi:hypothetical protein